MMRAAASWRLLYLRFACGSYELLNDQLKIADARDRDMPSSLLEALVAFAAPQQSDDFSICFRPREAATPVVAVPVECADVCAMSASAAAEAVAVPVVAVPVDASREDDDHVAAPVDPLTAEGWTTLPLTPAAAAALARAMRLTARLRDARDGAAVGAVATTGDVLVAHWPERSQRRVIPNVAVDESADDREAVEALRDARRHLAAAAASLVGTTAGAVLASSTTDAFLYGADQTCAAIVEDAPGLEVFSGGAWIAPDAGPARCVVLAGKAARAAGFDAEAVEHRVVGRGGGRTSITMDVHPTPERAARSAVVSERRLYFEMRINTKP